MSISLDLKNKNDKISTCKKIIKIQRVFIITLLSYFKHKIKNVYLEKKINWSISINAIRVVCEYKFKKTAQTLLRGKEKLSIVMNKLHIYCYTTKLLLGHREDTLELRVSHLGLRKT